MKQKNGRAEEVLRPLTQTPSGHHNIIYNFVEAAICWRDSTPIPCEAVSAAESMTSPLPRTRGSPERSNRILKNIRDKAFRYKHTLGVRN
jgi:hypothetical protein